VVIGEKDLYSKRNTIRQRLHNLALFPKQIRLREPREEDGSEIWQLVKSTGVLDLNSPYSYIMLCKYFSGTCVVAEYENKIVGFLSAFRPPGRTDVIFVWQVAVACSQHRKGLGAALLKELLKRRECAGIRFLETTVTPSNIPSQSLFKKLARDVGAHCEVEKCFPTDLFPAANHEPELMYRIGPIKNEFKRESEAMSSANVHRTVHESI
jgi:L-2,4-diaminobutyric acid acetyltransferase